MKLFQKKEKYVEVMTPTPPKKWYEKLFIFLNRE